MEKKNKKEWNFHPNLYIANKNWFHFCRPRSWKITTHYAKPRTIKNDLKNTHNHELQDARARVLSITSANQKEADQYVVQPYLLLIIILLLISLKWLLFMMCFFSCVLSSHLLFMHRAATMLLLYGNRVGIVSKLHEATYSHSMTKWDAFYYFRHDHHPRQETATHHHHHQHIIYGLDVVM